VEIRRSNGSIVINSEGSPVEIKEIARLAKPSIIDITTTMNPITLHLPGHLAVALSAKTEYGKIRSDYPVYLDEPEEPRPAPVAGREGIPVRLQTDGDITVRKQ
jgi:hypothetical protein